MAVETIPALFLHAVKTYNKKDAFQFKSQDKYVDVSHREVFELVNNASLGLLSLGLVKGDRVAILSENRLEWAIADLAILSAGCINVPIYATLPANQIEYILKDCEARAVFVSTHQQLEKIQQVRDNLPQLAHVISFEDVTDREMGITLRGLEEKGTGYGVRTGYVDRIATIGKYDWATIIYTSGTTGDPKGTILTHWNFISNIIASFREFDITPDDKVLSLLPLSHVFERMGGYYTMMYKGVTIAYAESFDTVSQNMIETSPTIMLSVPRMYEKIYARVLDNATQGSIIKRNIFFWAVNVGKFYVKQLLQKRVSGVMRLKYKIAYKLVFKKLNARTGGRLRFFISGSAPLARDIAEFFYAAGLPILEGYGLTETSPVISVSTFEHFKFGTVGRPIAGVEVRIAEDGEILVRGPNVMVGYYKKPELTKEVLDGEWFHTGDIGVIDDDGFLTITDRKKDIIVTAGGKNVAPQPIENLFKTNKYISEVIVVGNKRKFISAIIVPNFDNLHAFASAVGIPNGDETELVKHPQIHQKYQDEIAEMSEHLAGFERVKKFILLPKDFTIEDGELTPSLKVKRSVVEKKFAKEIDALYAS